MKIVAIRHATRKRDDNRDRDEYLEKQSLLEPVGEEEARKLAGELASRGIIPVVYFTSCFAHAKQTGEIMRDTIAQEIGAGNVPAKVVELCTLTPHYQGPRESRGEKWQGSLIFRAIIHEAELTGNDLHDLDVVAIILHQPRLKQLLASMTPHDQSRFDGIWYGEGICLEADSLEAFLRQEGEEDCSGLGPRPVQKLT